MTIELRVRWDEGPLSVGSSSASGSLRYVAVSDDPTNDGRDEVLAAMLNTVPADLFGLAIDNISIKERLSDGVTAEGGEAYWDCEVEYVLPQTKQPYPVASLIKVGQARPVRVSIRNGSGGSVNMIRSKQFLGEATVNNKAAFKFGAVTELKNLLGFEANSSTNSTVNFVPRGIQKTLYSIEIGVETAALATEISGGYGVALSEYAGKNVINSLAWKGFPARCLQFVGFDMKQQASKSKGDPGSNPEHWGLSLSFKYQPPETITLPSGFSAIPSHTTKQGFEYLDILYMEKTVKMPGTPAEFTIPTPVRLALHVIDEEVDFSTALRLGSIL